MTTSNIPDELAGPEKRSAYAAEILWKDVRRATQHALAQCARLVARLMTAKEAYALSSRSPAMNCIWRLVGFGGQEDSRKALFSLVTINRLPDGRGP
jgi:hypothetical protein